MSTLISRGVLIGVAIIGALMLHGCGPDCQGLRGTIKNSLGGTCIGDLSSSSNAPSSVSVSGAATYIGTGGSTVQFSSQTTFADGEIEDTTSVVTWSLSNPAVGTIDANGLFTSSTTGGVTNVVATHNSASSFATLKVVGTVTDITVGTDPIGVYLRPNSTEAWVLNYDTSNQITIIDTSTNSVTQTIDFGAGNFSGVLIFLSDGSKAYVTTSGPPHKIWTVNGTTKAFSVVTTTTSYGVQPAVSPDDAFVYYAQNGGTSDVFRINTTTDTAASFDTTPACPTGMTITSTGKMYVSDQCHGGNDWIYVYADYTLTASTNFSITSFVANHVFSSPDGSRIFAVANPPDDTQMINGTTNAILDSTTTYGPWAFFPDNTRAIQGLHGGGYRIFDYTGATLSLLETLPGLTNPTNGGHVGIGTDDVLYVPVGSTNTIRVYQYHE